MGPTAVASGIETIGSWLRYGPSGLALGLVVGIILGIAGIKFNALTVDALKISLRYALLFLLVASVVTIIPLFANPTLEVNVIVRPDLGAFDPNAVPVISSSLTKHPENDIVEVSQRDAKNSIFVDVSELVKEFKSNKIQFVALSSKLREMQRSNAISARSYAIIAPKTKEAQAAVAHIVTAPNSSSAAVATASVCSNANAATCGWAHLAHGDVQAAQASFANAAADHTLSQGLRASAYDGLGYTYLTQGKTAQAVEQIKQSSALGDEQAKLQLNVLTSPGHLPASSQSSGDQGH